MENRRFRAGDRYIYLISGRCYPHCHCSRVMLNAIVPARELLPLSRGRIHRGGAWLGSVTIVLDSSPPCWHHTTCRAKHMCPALIANLQMLVRVALRVRCQDVLNDLVHLLIQCLHDEPSLADFLTNHDFMPDYPVLRAIDVGEGDGHLTRRDIVTNSVLDEEDDVGYPNCQ